MPAVRGKINWVYCSRFGALHVANEWPVKRFPVCDFSVASCCQNLTVAGVEAYRHEQRVCKYYVLPHAFSEMLFILVKYKQWRTEIWTAAWWNDFDALVEKSGTKKLQYIFWSVFPMFVIFWPFFGFFFIFFTVYYKFLTVFFSWLIAPLFLEFNFLPFFGRFFIYCHFWDFLKICLKFFDFCFLF